MKYRAPWWLAGGHTQTIWAARVARRLNAPLPAYERQRWATPDADFIDVDRLYPAQPTQATPLLVLFHGLEGSSRSHYAQAFAQYAHQHGMAYAVPHFRGCSGEINRAPRAYHSGDFEEVGWILAQLRQQHSGPMLAVGVSLGGNALLRWAQEAGEQAARMVSAVVSVCAPLDLTACGEAMGRGFCRYSYTPMFLRSMKPKALVKLAQYPGLFDRDALLAARNLYEFDNAFTAPLHGFANTRDYWLRASAKPHLQRLRVPTLVLNPHNDPFVPAHCLPALDGLSAVGGTNAASPAHGPDTAQWAQRGPWVTLWQPPHGGHIGFVRGSLPGQVSALPEAVGPWLQAHLPAFRGQQASDAPATALLNALPEDGLMTDVAWKT